MLSIYCVYLLLDCLDSSQDKSNNEEEEKQLIDSRRERSSYEEIGEAALGRWGRILVQVTLIYTQLVGFFINCYK